MHRRESLLLGSLKSSNADPLAMVDDLCPKSLRIALVEVDAKDFHQTRRLFERVAELQFEIEWFRTYAEGVSALERADAYDVFLVNHRLDGRSGLDLLRAARHRQAAKPFILLTSADDRSRAQEALRLGAADYLVKGDFDERLLERSLRYCVERGRTLEALRRTQERLRHDAYHDSLTGLPNRSMFLRRMGRCIERAKAGASPSTVLFLDFDRFKVINDSLGHMVGDQLLLAIARRLENCIRPEDMVARLGGDEFTVLLHEVADAKDAIKVAERIHEAIKEPFLLGGSEVFTSASIGIAVGGVEYNSPEEILRDADTAMYRAKERGRGNHVVFGADMHDEAVRILSLEMDLQRAIDREEFRLHYQPIVSLANGKVVTVEALIRWEHPEKGLMYPSAFLDVAEDSGLLIPLSRWVLHKACEQIRQWTDLGVHVSVAVNLSAGFIAQFDMVRQIETVLSKTGIAADRLEIEITENALMQRIDSVLPSLSKLKELGVRISLDDFGTGYSSLSYLHQFPIDTLKIDRSFIGGIGLGMKNRQIVDAIVTLGHKMGLNVIAEGVETEEQLEHLRRLGCDAAQGYYLSRPVPCDARRGAAGLPDWVQIA